MKIIFLFLALFMAQTKFAQTFTELDNPSFEGV